jgi:hypothetical protein
VAPVRHPYGEHTAEWVLQPTSPGALTGPLSPGLTAPVGVIGTIAAPRGWG